MGSGLYLKGFWQAFKLAWLRCEANSIFVLTPKAGRLLSISMISFGLTACSADTVSAPVSPAVPPSAKTPPTTLTGNWLLTGSRVPATYPVLSTSLFVQGNTISGMFAVQAQCTGSGIPSGIGGSGLALNGTIADDGTFQAASGTIGGGTLPSISVLLTGNSPPAAAPSLWTGAYSIVVTPGSAGSSCNMVQTGSFSASPIAALTGTYNGISVISPSPFGTASVVSVQISQGLPTLVTRGNTSVYEIPLTASLTIADSACALSTSTTGSPEPSFLSGDSFDIFFPITGPPSGVLVGTLNDATANAFSGDLTPLAQAIGCSGIAFYTFTKQ